MTRGADRFTGFEPDGPIREAVPTTVAPDRPCDFCSGTPTTHWLSFKPVPRRRALVLPDCLGSCSECARDLDFRDSADLVERGHCTRGEANLIARYLNNVTASS